MARRMKIANFRKKARPSGNYLWFGYHHDESLKSIYLFDRKNSEATSWMRSPKEHFVEIEYDSKGRVKVQKRAHGKLWDFVYHDYQTKVLNAVGNKTLYHYSTKNSSTIIDHYAKEGLIRRQRFF